MKKIRFSTIFKKEIKTRTCGSSAGVGGPQGQPLRGCTDELNELLSDFRPHVISICVQVEFQGKSILIVQEESCTHP